MCQPAAGHGARAVGAVGAVGADKGNAFAQEVWYRFRRVRMAQPPSLSRLSWPTSTTEAKVHTNDTPLSLLDLDEGTLGTILQFLAGEGKDCKHVFAMRGVAHAPWDDEHFWRVACQNRKFLFSTHTEPFGPDALASWRSQYELFCKIASEDARAGTSQLEALRALDVVSLIARSTEEMEKVRAGAVRHPSDLSIEELEAIHSGGKVPWANELFWRFACTHNHFLFWSANNDYRPFGAVPNLDRWRKQYLMFWQVRDDDKIMGALGRLGDSPTYLADPHDPAFGNCTSLSIVELPEGLTTVPARAFDGCTNLALTHLPKSVTAIGHRAFAGCTNLALMHLPPNLMLVGADAFAGCPETVGALVDEWRPDDSDDE